MRKSQCLTCDNLNKSSCWCSNHKVAMTEGTPGYFDKCSDYRKAPNYKIAGSELSVRLPSHTQTLKSADSEGEPAPRKVIKRAVEDVKCRGCGATGLCEITESIEHEQIVMCECGHEEVL